MKASGPFEVKLAPIGEIEGTGIGRMSLDKVFHGALEATSKGEMIAVRDMTLGSGVYVALEAVVGTLDGRAGGFKLAHRGVMDRGRQSLEIIVVPDSGEGDLKGISGTLNIRIEDGGKHFYDLDYEIAG